jgi:hypothetical protein
MQERSPESRMNRTILTVRPLSEEGDDLAFWLSRTVEERLAAAEQMRQMAYGYDPTTARLQRVLHVAELGEC